MSTPVRKRKAVLGYNQINTKGDTMTDKELELVPLTEAARQLGISRVTMSNLAKAGRFTVYESGYDRRLKLVNLAEVEAALAPRPIKPIDDTKLKKAAA